MTEAEEDDWLAYCRDDERELLAWLGAVVAGVGFVDSPERHRELVAFARSPLFSSAGCLFEGALGWLFREAARALSRDLEADTPQRRWYYSDARTGRSSIARLVGAPEEHLLYSTFPFRSWVEDGAPSRIAAAVRCPKFLERTMSDLWEELDVSDIILWDPRSNTAEIAGEHPSTDHLICPGADSIDDECVIYADPRAFFRDWTAKRSQVWQLVQMRAEGNWRHPIVEARDGGLPGALAIGRLGGLPWRRLSCRTLIAGPGVTKRELQDALIASANLPSVREGDHPCV